MKNTRRSGETEKYVAPPSDKKEYTLAEMQRAFKKGMITVLIVQAIVISVMYFRSHSINDMVSSLKSVSNSVTQYTQK